MPNLKLNFKDKSLGDYQLQKGRSITIGRRKNNDVVIDNLAVSSHHAKIDSVGDGFVLIDLKSKNGSFVNEQLINSHWLKQGDVINIGKHSLSFYYPEGEELPDDDSDEIDKTMVMDTSQYRSMMNKSKPKDTKHLTKVSKNSTVGVLAYLTGGNGEIKLTGKITKIGKDTSSDIIVKGLLIGGTAATISKRPDGFYLSYVGGLSKPKINEKTVKQSTILSDLDIIYLGSTKLQFFKR
ncbi:MAG: FHA domain-containing protein [Desulfobacterales bacterium]|nr:FHA domain-containing protein [Deltaproteobacteria bacterium]NNL75031.1 FHA domain-containing protein [Desulfobacterales bacterium]